MAKARIRTRTKRNPAFAQFSKKLKDAGRGDLRKKAKAAIVQAGGPIVADLRAATMGVDVKVSYITGVKNENLPQRLTRAPKSTGLRSRTAAAIGTQVLVSGIRIRVNGKRIDPQYGDNLARYLIGGKRRWRHPLFGNREVFIQQDSQDVWFETLKPHLREFRKAVQGVIDDITKELEG